MEGLEFYVSPLCNKDCIDMVLPFGDEEILLYQLPNALSVLDAAFLNMGDPSSFGDRLACSPVTKKVASFGTSTTIVDRRGDVFSFTSNSSVILPVQASSPGSIPRIINYSPRNRQSHLVNSVNSSFSRSIDSIPIKNYRARVCDYVNSWRQPNIHVPERSQPTHIPTGLNTTSYNNTILRNLAYNPRQPNILIPERSQSTHSPNVLNSASYNNTILRNLAYDPRQPNIHIPTALNTASYNNTILRNLAYNPRLGCISFVGLNGSLSEREQKIGLSSFVKSEIGFPNSCLSLRNQLGFYPAMTTPHTSANGAFIQNGSNFLRNSGLVTTIKSDVFNPARNQVGNTVQTHWPNHCGSLRDQLAFGPSSLHVGHISSSIHKVYPYEYKTCIECGKKFPTYQALGGHMSSHVKARKRLAEMTSQSDASYVKSSVTESEFEESMGGTSIESTVTSADENGKIEGCNFSEEVQQTLSSPSVEEAAIEDFSSSEEIGSEHSSILRKRSREEIFLSGKIKKNRPSLSA